MSNKLVDNNRRAHAAKVLAQTSKKNQEMPDVEIDQKEEVKVERVATTEELNSLNHQYQIIREDMLKLRADLGHGYDLLKEYIETKISIRTLLKPGK